MSIKKGKNMSKNLDLDLGIDEFAGQIKGSNKPQIEDVKKPMANKAKLSEPKEVPTKPTVANMSEFTWMTVPCFKYCSETDIETGKVREWREQTGKYRDFEIHTCSAEEFVDWMKYVYPPAEAISGKDIKYYNKLDARKQAFANLVNLYAKLNESFVKHSKKEDLNFKASKKKAKKNKGE